MLEHSSWMDCQMDGLMDKWMDQWMDGQIDGWIDGCLLRSPCTYRSMLFPGALQLSWYWFKGHLLTHGYGSNRVAGNLPPGEGHKQISIKS